MKINREGYKIIGVTGALCFALWLIFYKMLYSYELGHLMWFGTNFPSWVIFFYTLG